MWMFSKIGLMVFTDIDECAEEQTYVEIRQPTSLNVLTITAHTHAGVLMGTKRMSQMTLHKDAQV